jgi:hypothetical protein
MKILAILSAAKEIAPRLIQGVKDIKHLHKALKKNKESGEFVQEGQIDYVRLFAFVTTVASTVFGVLYAFGKIDAETYERLLEVLSN